MAPQNFTVRVKLNITNGMGDIVFDKIKQVDIDDMVRTQTNGAGYLSSWTYEWDSGFLTHDLYLLYHIVIDCKRAVMDKAGRRVGAFVNWLGLSESAVESSLHSSFIDGFKDKMMFAVVSFEGSRTERGHSSRVRF